MSLNPNDVIMSSLSQQYPNSESLLKSSHDFNIYGMWDNPNMLPCSYSTCGIISTLGGEINSTSGAGPGGGISWMLEG